MSVQLSAPVVQIPHRPGFNKGASVEKASELSPAAVTNEKLSEPSNSMTHTTSSKPRRAHIWGHSNYPATTYSGQREQMQYKNPLPQKKVCPSCCKRLKYEPYFRTEETRDRVSGGNFPAGRQRCSHQCEKQDKDDQQERDRQPDRAKTDEPRLNRHSFPGKHLRPVSSQIKRSEALGRLTFKRLLKSSTAILTNIPVPKHAGATHLAGRSQETLVHPAQ